MIFFVYLVIIASSLMLLSPASAQLQTDMSLGEKEKSLINNSASNSSPGLLVTGGAKRGSNLFHSFQKFNVLPNQSIYFDNSRNISNIFLRVTGDTRSNIQGTLGIWNNNRSIRGSSNLFLLNPNGIRFESGGRLDLNGSFMASTAEKILFGSDIFPAKPHQSSTILSNKAPTGLNFGPSPRSINVDSTFLSVPSNKTLSLLGGRLDIGKLDPDGTRTILAANSDSAGGRVELMSFDADNTTHILEDSLGWRTLYNSSNTFQNIGLNPFTIISVTGNEGFRSGDVSIVGKDIIFNSAQISSINRDLTQGGLINIFASDSIELFGDEKRVIPGFGEIPFNSAINVGAFSGNAGTIKISASNLSLDESAVIIAEGDPFSNSNAGQILISTDSLLLKGHSFISSGGFEKGAAGLLSIEADTLRIFDGSSIVVSSGGTVQGGILEIDAKNIEIAGHDPVSQGSSALLVESAETSTVPAGELILNTEELKISQGGVISTISNSNEQSGSVFINANNITLESGGQIVSSANLTSPLKAGSAGKISIFVDETLNISGSDPNYQERFERSGRNINQVPNDGSNSGIFGNAAGFGDAGNLKVSAPNLLITNSGQISATNNNGKGGLIEIISSNIDINSGGQVISQTRGTAQAGSITFNISDEFFLDGRSSGIFANSEAPATGESGNIIITPNQHNNKLSVVLSDKAVIGVNSDSQKDSGNISIRSGILVLDDASVRAETLASRGGNINLNPNDLLLLLDGSSISAKAVNNADGGNIDVNSEIVLTLPQSDSDILANAFQGDGGNIKINTGQLIGFLNTKTETRFSDINASSSFGLDGTVTLEANDEAIIEQQELPTDIIDSADLIASSCSSYSRQTSSYKQNNLSLRSRDQLPALPGAYVDFVKWSDDWVTLSKNTQELANKENISKITNPIISSEPLVEAEGWIMNQNGITSLVVSNNREMIAKRVLKHC